MNDDLNGLIQRLAEQPAPSRLDRLEMDVARGLSTPGPSIPVRSWRFAATGLALALGVGVGSSAAALRHQPALAADLTASVRLAPSSLLDVSQ